MGGGIRFSRNVMAGHYPVPGRSDRRYTGWMRSFEIIAALIAAVAVFVVLKLLGLLVKFAAIAAVLGFVAGLWLAHMLRRRG